MKLNKKVIIYIIIVLIIVIIVPIIIDKLYFNYDGPANTTLSSSDLVNYWGIVLSGGIVLLSLYITIKHTDDANKETRRKQIKPKITSALEKIEDSSFINRESGNLYIQVTITNAGMHMITGEAILYRMSELYTREIEGFPGMRFMEIEENKRYLNVNYTIENYGNDSACDIKFYINDAQVFNQFSVGAHGHKKIKMSITMAIDFDEEFLLQLKLEYLNIDSSVKYTAIEAFTAYKDTNRFLMYKQRVADIIRISEDIL